MALSEDAAIGSSTAVGLKLGSNGVALLVGTADPDGNTDPWKSAAMGSIYLKYAETDDTPGIWQKVDDDNSNDDWVKLWVDKDEESGGRSLECDLTMDADKRIYFRDTGLSIHSSGDGVIQIVTDGTIRFGDGTNDLVISSDGTLTLEGTAKVTAKVAFPIATGGGTANREIFLGASTINFDADGETCYVACQVPDEWDGASDLTIVLMVANEIAEDDGDDVSFTGQVRSYADGATMGAAGQTVAFLQDLTGGDQAINVINRVTGTIDYGHGTYPVAAGGCLVIELTANLGDGTECTGPLHIVAWWMEYTKSKLGTA